MKIFKIEANTCGYYEYDSIIVACESKEKLQKLIDDGVFYKNKKIISKPADYWYNNPKDLSIFEYYQKLSIE